METLGQKLRKAREQKGWSVEEAASRLKIHVKYFHAIESGDTASLPGSFFYRSFVRQYASLVGLPESAYALELDSAAQSHLAEITREQPDSVPQLDYQVPPMPTDTSDPREETKRWALRLALLALVMGLCSGGYVLWQRWKAFGEADQAAKSQQSQAPAPQTAQQTVPPPVPVPTEPVVSQESTTPAGDAGQTSQSQPGSTPATQQVTPPVTPQVTTPAAPQATQAAAVPPATEPAKGPINVTLTAKESVWVDVWVENKRVHSNVIAPGQSKSFAATGMLRVRYGNAGGIDVQWNGKGTETPGPRGQIRTWEYLPGSYRMVPVAPKTPPAAQQPPAAQ